MSVQVRISSNGRICIPADVREQLGVRDGDTLLMDVADGTVTFTTMRQRIREIQAEFAALTKGRPRFTSEDLIRERREEAAREEKKYRSLHGD